MTLNTTIQCRRNLRNARRTVSFLPTFQTRFGDTSLGRRPIFVGSLRRPPLSRSLCGLGSLHFSLQRSVFGLQHCPSVRASRPPVRASSRTFAIIRALLYPPPPRRSLPTIVIQILALVSPFPGTFQSPSRALLCSSRRSLPRRRTGPHSAPLFFRNGEAR